jgi:CRISPR-associated endonuclease/helicase Cas3
MSTNLTVRLPWLIIMLSEPESKILQWPGKSNPENKPYPAAAHMLDVAAVAKIIVARTEYAPEVKDAIVLLTALHDLGKFSTSFRNMLEGQRPFGVYSHWELSECLLQDFDSELLGPALGNRWKRRYQIFASTAGHHGRPPSAEGDTFNHMLTKGIGNEAQEAAAAFVRLCLEFWPTASLAELEESEARQLSWWLPGFVTVCDWIGSNTEWFPATMQAPTLAAHLEMARHNAKRAVAEAGLDKGDVRDKSLYDFALRPMQRAATEIPLPEGPMLAFIEDETGAGKTEAAMLLAQRMLQQRKGNGIFFALPTMATSNAMFERAAKTVGKLFKAPSLTLAHGRAGLNITYNDVQGRSAGNEDDVTCAPWLVDGRRRALLAQVGVGTIDQALLSVLPTKHNCLRIWGLSQKILIVDEVHELGTPYMAEELKVLLQSHAMQGGSAILLSATLPLALRQKLASAFEEGAARSAPRLDSQHYPSLLIASCTTFPALPVIPALRGKVAVQRISVEADAASILMDAASKGAACVWVRNSVDDAIAAKEMLEAMGASPPLFHARFAFGDRQRIENDVLQVFGRERESRIGRILIATHVVESSLDLDFDVMISDLAPMAALIQRAGRLWRHIDKRPTDTRPVPQPILHVLSPDPADVKNEMWLKNVMNKGAYVYPAAEQWRTAKHLFEVGEISAPEGLRNLVEAVHGADVETVPEVLIKAENAAIGKDLTHRNQGQQNTIDLSKDYRSGGAGHDDVNYPTRLGPPQRTLMLVKRDGEALRLWCGEGAGGEMLSEVSVAKHRIDKYALPQAGDESAELQAFKKDWPDWKKHNVTVVEVGSNGRLAEGVHYSATFGVVFHNRV